MFHDFKLLLDLTGRNDELPAEPAPIYYLTELKTHLLQKLIEPQNFFVTQEAAHVLFKIQETYSAQDFSFLNKSDLLTQVNETLYIFVYSILNSMVKVYLSTL